MWNFGVLRSRKMRKGDNKQLIGDIGIEKDFISNGNIVKWKSS